MAHAGFRRRLKSLVALLLPFLVCGHALLGHSAAAAEIQNPTFSDVRTQEDIPLASGRGHPAPPRDICDQGSEAAVQSLRSVHESIPDSTRSLADLCPAGLKPERGPPAPIPLRAEHLPPQDTLIRSSLQMWLI
ncbi:hypothetical protein GCM10009801_18950 [Streptomyces albiaxialis]|uniref:Uncharacterized protein n=1 Tax=Streptomyces albiaxialis TaxID=329523 RepID=A0ABN2VQB7_9ACTN